MSIASVTVQIEQAIARGWDDPRIATDLGVSLAAVINTRLALDALAEADAFAPLGDSRARREHCRSGRHVLTGDNVYIRPDGDRECAACRLERRQRSKCAA